METLEILSQHQIKFLKNWIASQELAPEIYNNKPTGRQAKWWGFDGGFGGYKAIAPEPLDPVLRKIVARYNSAANAALLYEYAPGIGIGEHRDKDVFAPEVVMINLIEGDRDIFGQVSPVKFRWNKQTHWLQDGQVIKFNSKIPHSVPPVQERRWSIQLRKIS